MMISYKPMHRQAGPIFNGVALLPILGFLPWTNSKVRTHEVAVSSTVAAAVTMCDSFPRLLHVVEHLFCAKFRDETRPEASGGLPG